MGRRENGISNNTTLPDGTVPGKQRAADAVANGVCSVQGVRTTVPYRAEGQTNTDSAYDLNDPAKPGQVPVLNGDSPAKGAV